MANPTEGLGVVSEEGDEDDRVGEAVEVYMLASEQGQPPALDEFVARYPGLEADIRAALDGLELVHGLLGLGSATGSGSGRRGGLDHRIESGRRIAGYRVVRELGRGGMGTVYEAVHVGLDRPVALKVLGVHAAPDSSARRRFLNEARTAAGLHHTHIVPVFDVGQVGGLCYYAMQRIEGSGLDRVLKHLRRTRQVPSGAGDALSSSGLPSFLASGRAGSQSNTFRLSRLWGRLPVSLGGGRNKLDGPPERTTAAVARSASPVSAGGRPRIDGPRPPSDPDGSTASWGTASHEPRQPLAVAAVAGLSAVAPGPLAGLTAPDQDRQRRELEPPPYDPPRGPAYFRWVAKVGRESADALAHAHEQGVIHRDVKPSNLLIDARGSIWVTDFGLARRLADPGITHHDSLLGTPRYMSPEQARTGTIDGRTDVYSLGATLYELLTLRPPFNGQTAAELIDQIGHQEPVPPTKTDRRVPRDLETIALKALAKRPSDRYATAGELFEDLERFLNREPVKARRIGLFGRAWRVARRHPGITAVSTAAAAIVLAIATIAYLRVLSERNLYFAEQLKAVEANALLTETSGKERALRKELLRSMIEQASVSGAPSRRRNGLERIKEAANLESEGARRTELRDWAVKFLVLREIEAVAPELTTGKSHGLLFTPGGNRLAVLSEEEDELAVWDINSRNRLTRWSLRGGAGTVPRVIPELQAGEAAESRSDSAGGAASGPIPGSSGPRGPNGPGGRGGAGRPNQFWQPRQRLAQIGPYVASVLPDGNGLGLFELLSGSPLRILDRLDHSILGVVGESTGRRLVTIERSQEDSTGQSDLAMALGQDPPLPRNDFQVYLWNSDQLDRPIAKLPWRVEPMRRGESPPPPPPLVALSPDGKTVAVAPFRGTVVKLYSAHDGSPIMREGRETVTKVEIDAQVELSAIALGPDNVLATAGQTAGGVAIRIWDLDSDAFPRSLPPPAQNVIRLMRFSPQGNLLAIMGSGPIELWDPVALNLVAVTVMAEQEPAIDIAFAPDGRTLAAVSRAGEAMLWTVHDSAVRTQLSGFDNWPASLAFSDDGVLAGVSSSGDIWSWRIGRCPEIGPPSATASILAKPSATELRLPESSSPESQRHSGRPPRGEQPRGMRTGPSPSMSFDATGQLLVHDMQGLRVYPGGPTPLESPPPTRIATPPMREFGPGRVTAMAKTPDGRTIVLVRTPGIYLWHADAPGELVPVELREHAPEPAPPRSQPGGRRPPQVGNEVPGPQFRSIQIAPRGDRIFMVEQRMRGGAGVLRVCEIEATSGAKSARAREIDAVSRFEGVMNIALRPDGQVLAVGERSGQVTLLDTTSFAVLGSLRETGKDQENLWRSLAFSPDGNELAVGSQQGTISLWSVQQPTRPLLHLHLSGHRGWVNNLVFDSHGRRLACSSFDPTVEVWDLEAIDRELLRLKLAD